MTLKAPSDREIRKRVTVYLRLKHAGVNHVEISFLVFYTTISSTRACGGWTELYRI